MQKTAFCEWPSHGGTHHIVTGHSGHAAEKSDEVTKTLLVMTSRKARGHRMVKKLLLAMNLTAFLLTAACLNVVAKGLSQHVTFSGNKVSLETVFTSVEGQTGFLFLYSKSVLLSSKPVSINVHDQPLDKFLKEIFNSQPLDYSVDGKNVFVFRKPAVSGIKSPVLDDPALKVVIKLHVADDSGNPLVGASVVIKGKDYSTIALTDASGTLDLSLTVGDTVRVSYVGYKTFETVITRQHKILNVVLTSSTAIMNEVTVKTGFQTISKERVTGSYVKIEGNDIRQKSLSINPVDMLEGLVSGLSVNYGEGNDKFLIRGVSSVNANRSPLYVVDGVPLSYDDITRLINPNDIQDIVILKDAMATSIWGAQAANGVIVITTKNGKTLAGKIKVQYNGFVSLRGLPDFGYQKMLSSQQFINASKEIFDPVVFPYSLVSNISPNYQLPIVYPHEQIQYDLDNESISQAEADRKLDSLSSLNNRSQINQYLQQRSMLTNNSVSFTGGNPFYSFYGSLNYTNTKNVDRSNINNYMVNFRQNFNFTPFIKLDLTTNISQDKVKRFVIPNLPVLKTYLPYAMFQGDNGPLSQSYLQLFNDYRLNAEQQSGIGLDYIPLNEAGYAGKNDNTTLTARINAGLTINFLNHFAFEGRYQYASGNNNNYQYYDQNSYLTRREVVSFTEPGPTYYLPTQGGNYYKGNGSNISWAVRNQLSYNNSWKGDEHQVTALAGTEVRDNLIKSSSSLIRGYDFQTLTYTPYNEKQVREGIYNPVIPNLYSFSLLSGYTYTGKESEARFFSVYGNLAYAFRKKYNINASLRMDQSNLFGTDISQQYKPIWSIGGSWLVSKESFFNSNTVNSLKLRLTYGIGGNSPNPGSGGPYNVITPYNNSLYNNVGLGYYIVLPSNDKLIWERTATLNAGIDIALLDNRLSITVDAYDKRTSDLLATVPFDPTNGWLNGYTNAGDINNKGVELGIQSTNIINRDFMWTTNFSFGYNHNKIVKLGSLLPLDASGKLYGNGFTEGYSAYSLFAVKWAGLDNEGNPRVYTNKGDKVKFLNEITPDDVHYAGTSQPVYYGGLTNTFRYKGVELSFLIAYNLGHKMRKYLNQYYSGRLTNNTSYYFNDRWKKPGDEAFTNIPGYIADPNISQANRDISLYTFSDINAVSASYVKLRDLTLAYNIPVNWVRKLSMDNLRIYVQMNNMLIWTANDQGIDPEYYNLMGGVGTSVNAGSGSSLGGAPAVSLPDRMRPFFTFGLNVNFK